MLAQISWHFKIYEIVADSNTNVFQTCLTFGTMAYFARGSQTMNTDVL